MAEAWNNSKMVPSPDTTVQEPVTSDSESVYIKQEPQLFEVPCISDELRSISPTEPKLNKRARPRPDYMRHVKSPFSYVEMISFVIESNAGAMLTLRDIISFLSKTFPCLSGDYVGWKNSVRHTLSINECFKKVLRRPDRPYGKDNFWIMNVDCKHCKLSRTDNDLEIRYQQYMQQTGETDFLTQQHRQQRFSVNLQKRTPHAAVSPVNRLYQVVYPRQMPMPIPLTTFRPVMNRSDAAIDLSSPSQNSRKRPSLDNEPLDLSVKKFKSSPSTSPPTQDYVKRSSPVSSNGSCSPDIHSYSPQLLRTRIPSPEPCVFRSELHFPPTADRTGFMNSMTGRMYEYGQDGYLKLVQTSADTRRPIYILSNIPRPRPIQRAEEYTRSMY